MNKRILKKRVASLLLIFMMLLGVMTENENVLAENKKVDLHIINLSITDSILSLIARPHIRQHIVHGMPNVRQTVDIKNSSSDVGVLFSHDIYYITSLVLIEEHKKAGRK